MPQHDYKLKVSVDQSVCVGAGLCVMTTEDVFDQRDEDGIVKLLQAMPPEELYEKVRDAAGKCPSMAIRVVEVPVDDAPIV